MIRNYFSLGPFRITNVDAHLDNVTLDLPAHLKIHPTFHVSKLTPFIPPHQDFPLQTTVDDEQPLPAIDDQGCKIYELEEILAVRKKYKHFEYFVKWKGYANEHNSWIHEEQLDTAAELLADFNAANPGNIALLAHAAPVTSLVPVNSCTVNILDRLVAGGDVMLTALPN